MSNKITQLHGVSPEEFRLDILKDFSKILDEFKENLHPETKIEWLTRKEVGAMLSVSLVTIHNWCAKGILTPYKIGRQVRFKRSEINRLLESSNQSKLK